MVLLCVGPTVVNNAALSKPEAAGLRKSTIDRLSTQKGCIEIDQELRDLQLPRCTASKTSAWGHFQNLDCLGTLKEEIQATECLPWVLAV